MFDHQTFLRVVTSRTASRMRKLRANLDKTHIPYLGRGGGVHLRALLRGPGTAEIRTRLQVCTVYRAETLDLQETITGPLRAIALWLISRSQDGSRVSFGRSKLFKNYE